MTVSYHMTVTDTWQYLSYLSTRTIMGRLLFALLLAAPLIGPISMYHAASLQPIPPSPKIQHLMALESWSIVGGFYVTLLFSGLLGLYLGALRTPKATVTIDAEFCRLKTFTTVKARWKQVFTVAEEPDYFYFIGWLRTFYVPKRAFNSSAESYAFFDMASGYWRKAKGIASPPAPDVFGVWPPAPRAGDS